MYHAPSKRLRFRFFPEDDHALEETLRLTSYTSKSSVIRGALIFFDQVWTSQRGGFRVVFCRQGVAERPSVLDSVLARFRTGAREPDKRARTEKSIEIRLTRADSEKIDRLLTTEAADTFSDVVRRAIRLYATAVMRQREGWDVVAVSPSGDMLPMGVPGLAGADDRPAATYAPEARPVAHGAGSGVLAALPQSLAEAVKRLAAREHCAPEMLLVDLVRTETFARLHGAEASRSEQYVALEPVEEPQVLTPAPEPPVDLGKLEEAAATLEQMAEHIEQVMQIVGDTTRGKGPQAQLSDLLLGMEEDAIPEAASPAERIALRATQLNERLAALVALTQRQKRGKA